MTIKEILDDYKQKEEQEKKHWKELQEQTAQQIEARIERLNRCFEEVILPSVREVEKDLQGFGLWHKIHVGQTTSPNTGRQNIQDVAFYFYPEKFQTNYHRQRLVDASYKAFFRPSGDYRKVALIIRFPQRLPQTVEMDEEVHKVEDLVKVQVDGFLERFIKGALDAYKSDRLLL